MEGSSVKIIVSKPAYDGYKDRGAKYHTAAHYDLVDEDGNLLAEIRFYSGSKRGEPRLWTVRHIASGKLSYEKLLKDAKAKAFDMHEGFVAEEVK